MVSREELIQTVLDLYTSPNYLEIGVANGATFMPLRAASKVAVDPAFQFDIISASLEQPESEFHPSTSDRYFGELERGRIFDVIYLDGLHTFEQTLRDLMNSIAHLSERGVIIVDDVRPSSYGASLRSEFDAIAVRAADGVQNHDWMGDVYHLVYFVEAFLPSFSYATTSDNHGQLILWPYRRTSVSSSTMQDILSVSYANLILDPSPLCLMPLTRIIHKICSDLLLG